MKRSVTEKEFAQEVFVGVTILFCLFAIFIFVALQKSTGKSLSPLAYLWPQKTEKNVENPQEVTQQTANNKPAADAANSDEANTEVGNAREVARSNVSPTGENNGSELTRHSGTKEFEKPSRPFTSGFQQASVSTANGVTGSAELKSGSFTPSIPPQQSSFQPGRNPGDLEKPKGSQASFNRRLPSGSGARIPADFAPSKSGRTHSFGRNPENQQPLRPVQQAGLQMKQLNPPSQPGSQPSPTPPQTGNTSGQNRDPNEKTNEDKSRSALKIEPAADDSYWTISEEYYGDGKYFRELAKYNKADPANEQLPNPLWVPPLNELLSSKNKTDPKREKGTDLKSKQWYSTSGNETLFDIARQELDSAARFIEIIKLNSSTLPPNCDAQTKLPKGLQLRMPMK